MKFVLDAVEGLWNLAWIKGHRTQVAQVALVGISGLMAYQGIATDPQLLATGIHLPALSAQALMTLGPIAAYFGTKITQFANEHQEPPRPPAV